MPNVKDLSLAVAITWALYVPERGEVVVSPYVTSFLISSAKADAPKRAAFAQPALAHELVHVLQEQHFQTVLRLRNLQSRNENRMLKFLVEGHATWVEENLAVHELGHATYAEWAGSGT